MGHIKGSLGHGGWYLTQIHIFHSDGRGTVEGSGRVRVGCVWVVGLPEHAGGGWVTRCGATRRGEPRVRRRKSCARPCVRVRECARAWNGWVFGWIGQGWCVPAEGSWYAGTQACGAPAPPPHLLPSHPLPPCSTELACSGGEASRRLPSAAQCGPGRPPSSTFTF